MYLRSLLVSAPTFLLLLGVCILPATLQAAAFEDLPDTTEFTFVGGHANTLLGGVRTLTTGDYDLDGDEDIFVTRWARESAGVKQFVIYWNQFEETGILKFEVAGSGDNGIDDLDTIESDKNQAIWDEVDGTQFAGTVTADFNEDGWPDIFVGGSFADSVFEGASVIDRSLLYINLRNDSGSGLRFKEIGLDAGFEDTTSFCTGAAVADFNRDGTLDIFLSNMRTNGTQGGGEPNILYMGTGSSWFTSGSDTIWYPTFTDSTSSWGVLQGAASDTLLHFAPSAADFDQDGDLDIYVGVRERKFDSKTESTPNLLLVNQLSQGSYTFEDSAAARGVDDNGNAYGTAWGDFDNDGDLDLLMSNNDHPDGHDPSNKSYISKLYENKLEAGTPVDFDTLAVPDFLEDFALKTNNGVFFFDYDLDGLQDFLMATHTGMSSNDWGTMLFHQVTADNFEEDAIDEGVAVACTTGSCLEIPRRIPNGSNSVYADFDSDGDLDLFLTETERDGFCCADDIGTFVFENVSRDGGGSDPNFLTIRLKGGENSGGAKANVDGIGSVVYVHVGSTTYMQQVNAGAQDGSSIPYDLTFGLDTASSIDSVVVDWYTHAGDNPFRQNWGALIAGQRLLLKIDPDTLFTPGDAEEIQLNINQAVEGTVVAVSGVNEFGQPKTWTEWVEMKDGVNVVPIPGTGTPTINGASLAGQAVGFPDGVDSTTVLDGFIIKGGTTQIVHMGDGSGILRNCTVQSSGTTATMGINITDGTGVVDNCTVEIENDTGSQEVGIRINGAEPTIQNTSITVERGIGIHVTGGEPTVSDCEIKVSDGTSSNRGVKTDGSPTGSGIQVDHVFASVPGGKGVEVLTSNNTLEFCTVDSASTGFHDDSGGTVRNCIATNCTTDGFNTKSTNKATYSIAPDGYSPSAGTGSVTEDPYYCVAGSEYTLRVDSYGNPENNASGLQIGAFPVACMYGTLARDSKFGGGTIAVTADATVPSGKLLTLTSDAVLEADSTVMVTAIGTLRATGGISNPVVFRGKNSTAGYWEGIRAAGNPSKLVLTNATITDAVNCVWDDVTNYPADSLYVSNVTMSNFENAGVMARPYFTDNSAYLSVLDCTIDMSGAPYGIYVNRDDVQDPSTTYRVHIRDTSVIGDNSGTYAVYVDSKGTGQNEAKIENLQISDLSAGTGIYVEGFSPTISTTSASDSTVISGCKWGIELNGDDSPTVDGSTGIFRIDDCTEGIAVADECDPTVDDIVINQPDDNSYGLHTMDSAEGTYTGLMITEGRYGVRAWSGAVQTLRSSSITEFNLFGVVIAGNGLIDLGDGNDEGNNIIYSDDTTYVAMLYVGIKNRISGLGDIMAEGNWWGETPPPSGKFHTAVDYTPWLTTAPTLSSPLVQMLRVPIRPTLASMPNPFRAGGTVVEFGVPAGSDTRVRLELFDINGRRIRTLVDEDRPPGYHRVTWDGRGDHGVDTATGVYFIRYRVGADVKTAKIVRLR